MPFRARANPEKAPIVKNFFDNLSYKLIAFMQGRNGMDTLAQYALGAGLILTVLDFFLGSSIVSALGLAALIYSMFRCYSKNVPARALENAKFEAWVRKPKAALQHASARWKNRKTLKYLKCPQCGQSLSVPKGKGTLRVTCPKCHAKTTVKS